MVGGFDGQGASGVDHAGPDALPGDDQRTAAAAPTFDAGRLDRWDRWWAGGSGVADPAEFGGGEPVGQAAQQGALVGDLQKAAVDADGDPATGEVDSDRPGAPGRWRWVVARLAGLRR